MNNTLIKGLRLLEVLVARAQPVGISELAQELEMGASNVHRLLQALVELGYAVNEGGRGGYRASLKVWELGAQALHKLDFRETAAPAMRMLLAGLAAKHKRDAVFIITVQHAFDLVRQQRRIDNQHSLFLAVFF